MKAWLKLVFDRKLEFTLYAKDLFKFVTSVLQKYTLLDLGSALYEYFILVQNTCISSINKCRGASS